MDINLTGHLLGMPFNLAGTTYQPIIYVLLGGVAGALIAGVAKLIGDWLNRKRDREDEKNRLLGRLKGQKSLVLQYYAFYFFSFIAREYLVCRSVIQSLYEIDYPDIYSIPEPQRNKNLMRIANEARRKSIEHEGYLKQEEETKKWKLELAKSNKDLLTIIGSLHNYYSDQSFNEYSKQIELEMDTYAQLEQTVMDKFNQISHKAENIAGMIPQKAYIEESKIDKTLETRWTSLPEPTRTAMLMPRIIKLQDDYYYKCVESTDEANKKLKEIHKCLSDNLDTKLNRLIDLFQKQKKEKS